MSDHIRSTHAALIILDISGYTRFIHQRVVSLEHSEAIISELMESIIDHADLPLRVNKLEGDAALLYAETAASDSAAMHNVYGQVSQLFSAFSERAAGIRDARRHCGCDACANVDALKLKAIIHVGDIVVKRVRQFEEIAGDAVILLHRLLKNDVPSHQYVLLTQQVHALLVDTADPFIALKQQVHGMSPCTVYWRQIDTGPPSIAVPDFFPPARDPRQRSSLSLLVSPFVRLAKWGRSRWL